jgi:hypothetical protein
MNATHATRRIMKWKTWRRTVQTIAVAGIGLTLTSTAHAATWTGWGRVTYLEAGWALETVAVKIAAPVIDFCGTTNGGYATDPSDPGHNLFHQVLLQAFRDGRAVQLLLERCVFGKPRIIAVGIR